MRPYLTVLKDSFAEAFASRVLWILLVVLTLILLGLAPFGVQEVRVTELQPKNIADWRGFLQKFHEQANAEETSPGKHIWSLTSDATKKSLNDAFTDDPDLDVVDGELIGTVTDELNQLMDKKEFYDKEVWQNIKLDDRTEAELKDFDKLAGEDLRYLNRLLLCDAFPNTVANVQSGTPSFTWAGKHLGNAEFTSMEMVDLMINQFVAAIMGLFVGVIAIFVGILVTASIIPNTFEAGAVDLLLSKPVARPLLFLSKFFGGCAFILLNAGYFILGIYLILGLRFDIWNHNMLLCIPLFLFMFSIYYSVSAFAGVIWKNTIVCVVLSVLFWAACFTVGTTRNVLENFFLNPQKVVAIIPQKDAPPLVVNQRQELLEWQDQETTWDSQNRIGNYSGPASGAILVDPIYDENEEALIAFQHPRPGRGGMFGGGAGELCLVSKTEGKWVRTDERSPDERAYWLFAGKNNEHLGVGTRGVFRIDLKVEELTEEEPNPEEKQSVEKKEEEEDETAEERDEEGERKTEPEESNLTGLVAEFTSLGPAKSLRLRKPFAAAMDLESGAIFLFSNSKLIRLKRDVEGKYEVENTKTFEEITDPVLLASSGDTVVLAEKGGNIQLLDAETLEGKKQFAPAGKNDPASAIASPDGEHFGVRFHNGKLVLFDADGGNLRVPAARFSAATFDSENNLYTADRVNRVARRDPITFDAEVEWKPPATFTIKFHHYVINPLYTIFPKPGELKNVMSYLLTEEKGEVQGPPGGGGVLDPRTSRINLNIAGPMWSSAAFVFVMLFLTCLYIHRMDI